MISRLSVVTPIVGTAAGDRMCSRTDLVQDLNLMTNSDERLGFECRSDINNGLNRQEKMI